MQYIPSPPLSRPSVISVLALQAPVGELRGRRAGNLFGDVVLIQSLLNRYNTQVPCRALFAPLQLDGRCGVLTCRAITLTQRALAPRVAADGVIDPGGPTWQSLVNAFDVAVQQSCARQAEQAVLKNPTRPPAHVRSRKSPVNNTRIVELESALRDMRVRAFLDTIAIAEGTMDEYSRPGEQPKDPYRIVFGGREITNLHDHPHVYAEFTDLKKQKKRSCAAGKYQFMWDTWQDIRHRLSLPDFEPHSQDLAAVELMRECGALRHLQQDNLEEAIHCASSRWASFPVVRPVAMKGGVIAPGNSRYAQKCKSITDLKQIYEDRLDRIAREVF